VTTLVMRSLGRVAAPWVAIAAILLGFQVMLIAVAASFAAAGNFDHLASMVPAVLKPALAPALTSFGNMATLGYFDVLIVMMVVQWAIYVGTEPAGEIESGLVDLILARPLPRHRIVTRTLIVTLGSTAAIAVVMGLGTLLGLSLFAPAGADWPGARIILIMMAHLSFVGWCFGAFGVAVSGWASRRAAAIAIVAIASMALYLIDFLGLWWKPMEAVGRFTPFYYFHGGPILAGTSDPAVNLSVLGLATIIAAVMAYWRFGKRDL
jgi:ABC-2 type transport system permease protein